VHRGRGQPLPSGVCASMLKIGFCSFLGMAMGRVQGESGGCGAACGMEGVWHGIGGWRRREEDVIGLGGPRGSIPEFEAVDLGGQLWL
jgi:hypothetical protein